MRALWKAAAPVAVVSALLVLLFTPTLNVQRTVLAPDPASLGAYLTNIYAGPSYLKVNQTGRTSLAHSWFGIGPSPYPDTVDCSTPTLACRYNPASSYPDVFVSNNVSATGLPVDISSVHVTLNGSDLVSVVVSFGVRNPGNTLRAIYISLNNLPMIPAGTPVVDSGQTINVTKYVYPPSVPKVGDHFFLTILVSQGYELIRYVQVEG